MLLIRGYQNNSLIFLFAIKLSNYYSFPVKKMGILFLCCRCVNQFELNGAGTSINFSILLMGLSLGSKHIRNWMLAPSSISLSHTHTRTHTHTHTHTHEHTHTHTNKWSRKISFALFYTHQHAHAHTNKLSLSLSLSLIPLPMFKHLKCEAIV